MAKCSKDMEVSKKRINTVASIIAEALYIFLFLYYIAFLFGFI